MTKQTQTQLFSLGDFTMWILRAVISSGILFTIGVGIIISAAHFSQLSCSRPLKSCQHQISGPTGTQVRHIPIRDLQGAKLAKSSPKKRGKNTSYEVSYGVILLTRSGEVPLTHYYSGGYEEKQKIVSQIKTFISNPEQASLNVQEDGRLFAYTFGGFFVSIGLGVLLCILGFPVRSQLGLLLRHRAS